MFLVGVIVMVKCILMTVGKRLYSLLSKTKSDYFIQFQNCQGNLKHTWKNLHLISGKKNAVKLFFKSCMMVVKQTNLLELLPSLFNTFQLLPRNMIAISPYPTDQRAPLTVINFSHFPLRRNKFPLYLNISPAKVAYPAFKVISPIITQTESALLNKSLLVCTFPNCLKCVRIISIFKAGDRRLVNYY